MRWNAESDDVGRDGDGAMGGRYARACCEVQANEVQVNINDKNRYSRC